MIFSRRCFVEILSRFTNLVSSEIKEKKCKMRRLFGYFWLWFFSWWSNKSESGELKTWRRVFTEAKRARLDFTFPYRKWKGWERIKWKQKENYRIVGGRGSKRREISLGEKLSWRERKRDDRKSFDRQANPLNCSSRWGWSSDWLGLNLHRDATQPNNSLALRFS